MILGCIADDFTGAGDIASILTGACMRTSLVTNLRDIGNADGDAVVVALKTRSIAPDLAVAQSLAAVRALQAAGARQIYFKYCSTFDSTPQGNIGPVADALMRELKTDRTIICPAFPANGRTVYQGHLFVGDVLLAESGMRHHPITPMIDSDIRRWLAPQSTHKIGHIPLAIVRDSPAAIKMGLIAAGAGLIVIDATSDSDLGAIGAATSAYPLLTGGSALAMALPANYRDAGLIGMMAPASLPCDGPAIILAGSCSVATNRQVAAYRAGHPSLAIDAAALLSGAPVLEQADAFAIAHANDAPLIFSTIAADDVAAGRGDADFAVASSLIENVMAMLAQRAIARGARRIIVAGGETSGAVIEAVQPGQLAVGAEIAPGVPILHGRGVCYALKSGNFGDDDFFEKALATMEGKG